MTRGVTKHFQDVLDDRELVKHPRRRDGEGVAAVDEGEGVCQLCRVFCDMMQDVRMVADQPFELRLNQSNQVGRSLLETDIVEKSLEFLSFVQKFVINRLQFFGQVVESGDFIVEEVACFQTVIERVVHLLDLQLFIFHQLVIRSAREKERGEVQRVDGLLALEAGNVGKEFEVVVQDVVPAEVFGIADELREFILRGRMEFLFRFDERPEIIYFSTVGGDFGVDKSDNKALLRRWRERMAYPVQIFLNAGHGLLRSKSFQGAKVAFLTIDS